MKNSRILISKNMIPYNFDISLGDEMFNFSIGYNALADMFTVALKKDGETVCAGAPIIYGRPLFEQLHVTGKFPAVKIIPYGESGEHSRVTWDNFNETVFLWLDDGEYSITEGS